MNNREQDNMLFLKMCKMKVYSPCTWNIDDPNLLSLTAQKTETSLLRIIERIQRNFHLFSLSNHFRRQTPVLVLTLLNLLEPSWQLAISEVSRDDWEQLDQAWGNKLYHKPAQRKTTWFRLPQSRSEIYPLLH